MRRRAIAPAGVCALLGAASVLPPAAAAQVFQPGTQPAGEDGGIEVPIQTSFGCARCHGGYDDADDYEPHDSWRGSMMGSAARDPVFRAALAIAEEDNPDAADFCVRCHSPVAWLRGRSTLPAWSDAEGPRFTPDEEGFLSDDLDGVACMVCHRATDDVPDDPDAPYLQNAQLYLNDDVEADTHLGPYEYAAGEGPSHGAAQSEFLSQGRFCGQCHDIVNPVVDGHEPDGTPTGRPMAIERTFSEWRASAFADRDETCQDCHMPEVEGSARAAEDGPERPAMSRHDLVGGNHWVPRALAATVPDDTGELAALFERTAEQAEAMLQGAAELEITDASAVDGRARVSVRVTNRTGHKLPTGYPEGRRMWLEIAVLDAEGDVVDGSGLYDPAGMRLADPDDPQLRSYEIVLGQGDEKSFHFILNDRVLKDTRIPPEAFDPDPTLDMEPVGRDYTRDDGSYRHFDEASFELDTCGDEVTVRARLRFQTTTREYIEFLRDNAPDSPDPAIDNWGQTAWELWNAHGGGVPVDMAEARATVAGDGSPCPEPMPDAGPPDGGPADGGASDAGADGGADPDKGDGGCGCRAGGTRGGAPVAWLALAVGLLLYRRRWRRA